MDNKLTHKNFLHRGRIMQVPIYLGKQLRGFLYQNDWKVLPMAAVIAAVVAMVIKGGFFKTTEGTFYASFALTFVSIWNGCFNSIQVICRERGIVKRDHRSGMRVFSYIVAHMIYQALLCFAQAAVTVFVCMKCGIVFPETGVIFRHLAVEMVLTLFFIAYAADMVSLFISALVKNTTAAMTVMPFVLIFQLVFSGFFSLPEWGKKVSSYTIAHYGVACVSAEADYNSLGSTVAWNALASQRYETVSGSVPLGKLADLLANKENGMLKNVREKNVTAREVMSFLQSATEDQDLPTEEILREMEMTGEDTICTWGEIIDGFNESSYVRENRDEPVPFSFTVKQIMDLFGEENIRDVLMMQMAVSGRKEAYVHTAENVSGYWQKLTYTALLFALLAIVVLSFIDKDKR